MAQMPDEVEGHGGNPGPGVDIHGEAVGDPTANVLDLVEAAVKRLDDLRFAENKRLDDLREFGERHTTEILDLRAAYSEELREAESKRIDAIRAVDVAALNRATEVAAAAATALATQVAASAEALRNQVSEAASAQTVALAAALDPVQKDIADLRRAQYEAQGQKTQVVETQQKSNISGLWIGLGVAAVGLFMSTLIGITAVVLTVTLR